MGQIITAFASVDVYSRVGIGNNLAAVASAVAVTSFPFMLWTVLAAIEDVDSDVLPAATTMVLRLRKVERFLFRT
jgi:putative spermidine/putrescine transport system permease protein